MSKTELGPIFPGMVLNTCVAYFNPQAIVYINGGHVHLKKGVEVVKNNPARQQGNCINNLNS